MARQLEAVTVNWQAGNTGSAIVTGSDVPGISRATIYGPPDGASFGVTGSIVLESSIVAGEFVPVAGATVDLVTASLVDPWPQGTLFRLTADGPLTGPADADFQLVGQADDVPGRPDVGAGKSVGGVPVVLFTDMGRRLDDAP